MNIPKLRKNKTKKNYHGITLEDDYSWVDQPNILEVLKDPKNLNTEVKDYIEANNNKISYIGRDPAASPATGYAKRHISQQEEIIRKVFE